MVFSTIIFLCAFLPITIIGYYLTPGRGKNIFLLLCSLFFYAWGEPVYVFVMLASIICNYAFGMALYRFRNRRKLWLMAAVAVNLGILCVFKYTGFIVENAGRILPGLLKIPEIALPIGISFYTFQGLSYCIDVYRDEEIVQKNPFNLALYISMFPQLIAAHCALRRCKGCFGKERAFSWAVCGRGGALYHRLVQESDPGKSYGSPGTADHGKRYGIYGGFRGMAGSRCLYAADLL